MPPVTENPSTWPKWLQDLGRKNSDEEVVEPDWDRQWFMGSLRNFRADLKQAAKMGDERWEQYPLRESSCETRFDELHPSVSDTAWGLLSLFEGFLVENLVLKIRYMGPLGVGAVADFLTELEVLEREYGERLFWPAKAVDATRQNLAAVRAAGGTLSRDQILWLIQHKPQCLA